MSFSDLTEGPVPVAHIARSTLLNRDVISTEHRQIRIFTVFSGRSALSLSIMTLIVIINALNLNNKLFQLKR